MTLRNFVENSLVSKTSEEIFELEILEEACKAIKKHTNLNVCKYKFIIREDYIRHVKNGHPEDLDMLIKIPEILNFFSSVEKSITKNNQTNQIEVSLVFRKQYPSGIVRMVALRVMKGRILSFKTLFRQ